MNGAGIAVSHDYKWYVVHTKPRSELRAKRELTNQGYKSYLPEIQRLRLEKGREYIVKEPLFPRYLFIRLSRVRSRWNPIRSTRGVRGLVAFGDSAPVPISDRIVDTVMDGCRRREVEPRVKCGDRVRIMASDRREPDAATFWGQLASLDGEGRAVVLMTLLGRRHEIQIATDRLALT